MAKRKRESSEEFEGVSDISHASSNAKVHGVAHTGHVVQLAVLQLTLAQRRDSNPCITSVLVVPQLCCAPVRARVQYARTLASPAFAMMFLSVTNL